MKVLTAAQMREVDRLSVERGIPRRGPHENAVAESSSSSPPASLRFPCSASR